MYIVSYDITSNKLRRKIAKELENYGVRVQYSVFECSLDSSRFNEMYKKLVQLMKGVEEGNIRFYNLCPKCTKKTCMIGTEQKDSKHDRSDVIVL